jgi:uncharacterized protein (TIGR02271 family)
MEHMVGRSVKGQEGWHGQIERFLPAQAGQASQALIRLENGQTLVAAEEDLHPQADGSYYLPISLAQQDQGQAPPAASTREPVLIVPVVAEELHVGKRQVETGRARITKKVTEHEEVVDDALMREEVEIEHIPVHKVWEGEAPTVRYEGDTLVIPLLEEVLVVAKKLMLKEEVRISKRQTLVHEPQRVTLRSEEVTVERVGPIPAQEDTRNA